MVGKQVWRILTCPDSLVARIYKTMYFPTTSILEAGQWSNPSIIWRSLHASAQHLTHGVRLRVGTRSHIKLWKDPWLPDVENPYVTSPPMEGLEELNVSSLKSNDGMRWDVRLLRALLEERDSRLIQRIRLRRSSCDDNWLWCHERDRAFTIKSSYRNMQGSKS